MKVLVVNGSPRVKGCTARALEEVIKVLNAEGVETELMQIGSQNIRGCLSCGGWPRPCATGTISTSPRCGS